MKTQLESNRLFVVGGMARAGTTFLYHNFQLHPDVFVPSRKELAYFAYNYDHGEEWFQSFFKNMSKEKCAVDISPAYFMDTDSIKKIMAYGPNIRVILGIRRPLDWIYSMYGHYGDIFNVPPFVEFLDGCTVNREGKDYILEFRNKKIERTIEMYKESFGDRLFLYDFDILEDNPLLLMQGLEEFMGLSHFYDSENIIKSKVHARGADSGKRISSALNTVPGLANLISKIVPRSILMRIRRKIEIEQSEKKNKSRRNTSDISLTKEEREYAASVLQTDEVYYNDLFKNGPLIY